MKIGDLSIGDWVFHLAEMQAGRILHIYRIGEIYSIGLDCADCVVVCGINDIAPISLTPEILEKNGFVKNGEYDEWNIGTWQTPYLLGVSLERPAITIKWNGSSIFIDQAKNVHQLQHAFRLAGVGKEIEV